MNRYLIISIFSIGLTHAAETLLEQKDLTLNKNQNKSKLPTLEILPAGSILKNIRIPRYNPNYTNSSLLTAEQLEVISTDEIRGTNVNIRLYGEDGVEKTQTTLQSVSLNQETGIITSLENLSFSGESFAVSSQGLTIDIEKHRGFLLGRNHTIIYIKESNSMNRSKVKEAVTAALATTIATSPTWLTAQDIAQIDTLTQSSTEQFIQQLDKTKADLEATAKAEAKIEAIRKELENEIGNKPIVNKNLPAPPELVPIEGRAHIKISSDQLLFDAKKGLFVYFGNIKITHPKYSFTCDGQLKIILKESAAAQKLTADEKAKLKPNELFEHIEHIVATKNVVLLAKDNNGKNISAVTNSLIIQNINLLKIKDKKTGKEETSITGDIILKGKGSRLNTADGQLKVKTTNGYIKIDKDLNATGVGIDTDFIVPDKKN